jgi:hypothetical protein
MYIGENEMLGDKKLIQTIRLRNFLSFGPMSEENDLEHRAGVRHLLIQKLKQFYESFSDVSIKIHGGAVQVFLHEEGLHRPIPATRLSDGALRYLCLLAILCHPSPPPLVCIEEPELGLHPDILPTIAEMLVEASHKTQLIVTTHSDILVDALTSTPEAILVCERQNGTTTMRRLDADALGEWLKKYSLGELWRKGELGGGIDGRGQGICPSMHRAPSWCELPIAS